MLLRLWILDVVRLSHLLQLLLAYTGVEWMSWTLVEPLLDELVLMPPSS